MQYDFIYIKHYIMQTYLQQEKTVISWGIAAQLREAWIMKGYEETSVSVRNIHCVDCDDGINKYILNSSNCIV